MTQAELGALPEADTWSYREEMRHGRRVAVPVLNTIGAFYIGCDDGVVTDASGQRWLIGEACGIRCKRLMVEAI